MVDVDDKLLQQKISNTIYRINKTISVLKECKTSNQLLVKLTSDEPKYILQMVASNVVNYFQCFWEYNRLAYTVTYDFNEEEQYYEIEISWIR